MSLDCRRRGSRQSIATVIAAVAASVVGRQEGPHANANSYYIEFVNVIAIPIRTIAGMTNFYRLHGGRGATDGCR